MHRLESQRVACETLPCGMRAIAYRVRGAITTRVMLRIESWDPVFDATAPEWMRPHSGFCGHLLEHVVLSDLRSHRRTGVPLQGLWKMKAVEFLADGCPGDTQRVANALAELFAEEAVFATETLEAERERIRLEAHHERNGDSWLHVQELLDAKRSDLCAPPEEFDAARWQEPLREIYRAWVRPQRASLLIAGPHPPAAAIRIAARAFAGFPEEASIEQAPHPTPAQLPPTRIVHEYRGRAPAPALYAWCTPYLDAYRGALQVFLHAAHSEVARSVIRTGLAYSAAVGPGGRHVIGAIWCWPERTEEALACLRSVFLDTLDRLSDPHTLAEAKNKCARVKFRQLASSPSDITESYFWLRRLFPDARDPFSAHLREIATVSVEDIERLREEYASEERVTTVEYRRAAGAKDGDAAA